MLTEAEMAILLGRPLTTIESDNYDLYLNIATARLEELLCISLSLQGDDDDEASERTFDTRLGYRTAYVDPFTTITSVTDSEDEVVDSDDYTIKQNDKYNGSWYNIVEFDSKQRGGKIVIEAVWGFSAAPADLQLLLAKLFAQGSVEQTFDNTVKSKEIEDFKVTYKDSASFDEFVLANSSVIDKYSQCNQGAIRHGRVQSFYYY